MQYYSSYTPSLRWHHKLDNTKYILGLWLAYMKGKRGKITQNPLCFLNTWCLRTRTQHTKRCKKEKWLNAFVPKLIFRRTGSESLRKENQLMSVFLMLKLYKKKNKPKRIFKFVAFFIQPTCSVSAVFKYLIFECLSIILN